MPMLKMIEKTDNIHNAKNEMTGIQVSHSMHWSLTQTINSELTFRRLNN